MRNLYLALMVSVTCVVASADPPATDFDTLSLTVKNDAFQLRYPKTWTQKVLQPNDQFWFEQFTTAQRMD